MIRELVTAPGTRGLPLLAAIALGAALSGCGIAITQQQVLARANRNLAAQNYRAAAVDLQNLVVKRPNDASLHLKLADAFLHVGRYVEAEANLRDAQQLGAPWSRVLPELSQALLEEGEPQKALDAIAAHPAAGAPDERLTAVRGRALLQLGKLDDAHAALSAALAANPADTQARIALANLLARRNDSAGAKAALDQAVALAPQDFSAHMALALWYLRQYRLGDGRAELSRALEAAEAGIRAGREPPSDELRALAGVAQTDIGARDLSAADQHVARLHKLAPHNGMALVVEARLALAEKRPDDARTDLEEVLSHNSSNEEVKMLLGEANAAAGDLGQADMYLTAALAANPRDLEARKILAQVQLQEHKPQAALQTAADPKAALDADLLALAGRASLMTGDLADATQFLQRSEQAAPKDKVRALELAAAYLAQKRPDDALKLLKNLEVPPALDIRRELLLLTALKAQSPAQVGEEAQRFAAAHPRDIDALLLSGQALASVKDFDAARKLLAQASALDSHLATPWVLLGALELSQKNRAAADQDFHHALTNDPKSAGAELGEAELALDSGARAAAIQHLERARTLAPGFLPARLTLAQLYLQSGQFEQAASPLAEAARIAPDDARVQLLRGALALARSDASSAVQIFEQLSTRYPKSAAVQADLARAYMIAQRPTDARNASAEAAKLDPQYWPALVLEIALALDAGDQPSISRLMTELRASKAPQVIVQSVSGDVAARGGNLKAALDDYTRAAASAPSAALAMRIAAVRRAMHSPDAEAPLREWLRRSPQDAGVRLTLAEYLQADSDLSGAAKEYQAVLTETPNQIVALNNLAWLDLKTGNAGAALALARKAYGEAPNAPSVADTFGWALVQTGNTEDAVPVLRTAHAAAPKDASIQYHYAYALLKTGSTDEARRELKAIAEEQPHGPQGNEARSLLAGLPK